MIYTRPQVTAAALDVTGSDRRHIVRAYLSVCARRGGDYVALPDVVPATAEQADRSICLSICMSVSLYVCSRMYLSL